MKLKYELLGTVMYLLLDLQIIRSVSPTLHWRAEAPPPHLFAMTILFFEFSTARYDKICFLILSVLSYFFMTDPPSCVGKLKFVVLYIYIEIWKYSIIMFFQGWAKTTPSPPLPPNHSEYKFIILNF